MLKEQRGHIKGAFTRNDIGDVDLVWGDEKIGLSHIIKQRENQGINPKEFLSDLDEVIANGSLRFNSNTKRFEISLNGKTAIISPEFKGEKAQFVLTAFEIKK